MEVAELDHIIVDDRQPADARAGERRDDRAADAARADHRDPRCLELALPDAADLRQDDVPRIAFELLVGEAHRPVEPKPPAPRLVSLKLGDLAESRLEHRRRHQLRDPLAAADLERLAAEVGEDHLHLAAIIVVDRSRRVEAGDAVLERKARARTHLDFIALGNGDREAGRDRVALAGSKRHVLGGDDIEPGGAVGRVGWRRQTFAVRQPLQLDIDHFAFFRAGLRPPFLRRTLGRALIDQPNGFVERHRLRVGALGQRRMGRAVGDVGPVAARPSP